MLQWVGTCVQGICAAQQALKVMLYMQHSAAQHRSIPAKAVMWVTHTLIFTPVLVRIISFHPLVHLQFTSPQDVLDYRLYY